MLMTYSQKNQNIVTLHMASALTRCTKEEQRPVIRFLHTESLKPIDIYRKMIVNIEIHVFHTWAPFIPFW